MSLSTASMCFLNTSRDGDSTISLGSLFQWLTTLSVKKLCCKYLESYGQYTSSVERIEERWWHSQSSWLSWHRLLRNIADLQNSPICSHRIIFPGLFLLLLEERGGKTPSKYEWQQPNAPYCTCTQKSSEPKPLPTEFALKTFWI